MPAKAVFFDLFETLVSEFSNGQRLSNRKYDYNMLLGISNEEFKQEWASRQQQRMSGQYGTYKDVIRDIIFSKGLPFDTETVDDLYRQRIAEKWLPFLSINRGIIGLLAILRDRDFRIGLISNCTEEEVKHWPESELAPYFDDYIFSYDVKCAKPDSLIYKLACDRLQVKPEDCVFVGDGGSSELDGAAHAGLTAYHAVWFNNTIPSVYPQLTAPKELANRLQLSG